MFTEKALEKLLRRAGSLDLDGFPVGMQSILTAVFIHFGNAVFSWSFVEGFSNGSDCALVLGVKRGRESAGQYGGRDESSRSWGNLDG